MHRSKRAVEEGSVDKDRKTGSLSLSLSVIPEGEETSCVCRENETVRQEKKKQVKRQKIQELVNLVKQDCMGTSQKMPNV